MSRALGTGGVVLAARLEGYAGLLGRSIGPNKRFGTELSDYAKMAGGVHGLIHSDEDMQKYGFAPDELASMHKALHLGKEDAFILIADMRQKAEPAMGSGRGPLRVRLFQTSTRPCASPLTWRIDRLDFTAAPQWSVAGRGP